VNKLSLRQYKRLFGIQDEAQLASALAELGTEDIHKNLSPQASGVLRGLSKFLYQVDEAYDQADRDLALGKRSLELSSDELMNANRSLREESEKRQQAILTLRHTANEVLAQLDKHLEDDESLEHLSSLLAHLVGDLLKTRNELRTALSDVKNQQFALDQHAIVSITDSEGQIVYANDKFCEISQYAREELLGVNHNIVNSGFHSKAFFEVMWGNIKQGRVWHGEIRNRARDGSLYWTNATIVPFLGDDGMANQFISIRTDITEQRNLKEEIEASKRLLQNVMNTLGEGVYTVDEHGRCTYINPEAEKILGWTLSEVKGQILHDVIHGQRVDGVIVSRHDCCISQTISLGKEFRSEEEFFQHKTGYLFPVSIVASPIFDDGNIIGSVAAFQDITARHSAENALRQSEHKQRMMLDNAADAVFVANSEQRWIYINDLALQMLGYAREEILETPIYDLLPEHQRVPAQQNFFDQLKREKLIRQEIRMRKKMVRICR